MTATEKSKDPSGLARYMPIVAWLPNYDRSWLRDDIIAGLSVWALMVPSAMGYATIAGLPVQHGLYAAAAGLIGFALFTSSRQVTQGPSSSTAAVVGAAVLTVAAAGSDDAVAMAAAIALVAGLLYVIMYLFKLGWISEFLSTSVLTGFTFGIGLSIVAGELFKITGTDAAGSNSWQQYWTWITSLPESNVPTLIVGASALILVFGLKLLAPKIPGALVTIVAGIAATLLFNLGDLGVELIGDVPRGLPSFAIPDVSLILDNLPSILSASAGLLMIGFSVTTAAVREYANKHGYRIDINQELLAQGTSNIFASLVQGFFENASLSKSPVNDESGAKSQLSNLAQALFIILTLIFLAPFFSDLPEAVLGAVIIEAMVMGVMDVAEMKRLFHVKRFDFYGALAALLGVLTFGILPGVVIGLLLSFIWLVAASALPSIPELGRKPGSDAFRDLTQYPDSQTYPGLSVLRFDGGLFFVNADALNDRLRDVRLHADPPLTGVILSMEGVDYIDAVGADALKKITQAGQSVGIDIYLARVKKQVWDVLERDGVVGLIGSDKIHDDIATAVEMHLSKYPQDVVDQQISADS
jgi:SulP family sulfate permease